MVGKFLDGTLIANQHKQKIVTRIESFKNKARDPKLAVLFVGDNKASASYVNMLLKQFNQVGIETELIRYDEKVSQKTLCRMVHRLNIDEEVDGIIIQSTLPSHINRQELYDSIDPDKDVDGVHLINAGRLYANHSDAFVPCTAQSIMTILMEYNIELGGKRAVVIGRSEVVGKPVGLLLLSKDATVTYTHSKTEDLKFHTQQADIIIAAAGRPKMINADMIKKGAIIIDAGINDLDGNIVGDVDTDDVLDKCAYVTPVPGGVGPVTIAMLMENTIQAFLKNHAENIECHPA